MRALLVIAHGSPRVEANDDVRRVVDDLRSRDSGFTEIGLGYLDVNQPDIPAAIDALAAAGATEIVVVPYFLHTGKHVVRDLPELLEAGMQRFPQITITMGDYLGKDLTLAAVLRDRATS